MNHLGYWWRLLRLYSLPASMVPVLLGSVYAYVKTGTLNGWIFAAMALASALIHIAANLFNDYYDYQSGLDTKESVSLGGGIVHEGAAPQFIWRLAILADFAALLLGLYLCAGSSWLLAIFGGFFVLIGYFYTGGPWPIAYMPFGEFTSGICMGGGITCIAYFVQTSVFTWDCLLVAVPMILLIGLIMASNNIRDRVGDGDNGRRTVAVLLGHKKAVYLVISAFIMVYLWPFLLMFCFGWSILVLLPLLSIPKAITVVRILWPVNLTVQQMMPAVQITAQISLLYGLLYIVGILFAV